jgi:putative transposase
MPRRARLCLADVPFHVIQRGHNRNPCFFREEDYRRYLDELGVQALRHGVGIHAYVLMTNHVHLLATPPDADALGLFMKSLGQRYVHYVNRSYERTGTLWGGRFRSCLVDSESYLLVCHRYIECNPVRAGMVATPGAYRWSSYRANALGASDPVLTPHPCVAALGKNAYRDLFLQELDSAMLDRIRDTTNAGFALGSDRFRRDVARRLGRRVEALRRGRKPRRAKLNKESVPN